MTVALTINGTTYDYPQTGDLSWGPEATEWAQAVTSGMLQKAGGLFQLLADVDFGTAYGVKALYYKSRTSNGSDAGQIRLARADVISWRNQANSANLDLGVNSSDLLTFAGTAIQPAGNYITALTGDVTASGPGSVTATIANNVITNVMVNSSAAIAYSKLNLSGSILNADISASAAIAFSKLAALTDAYILVGNVSNVATAVAVSGDLALANTGAFTIANSAVTNAKMANMANVTFKGNISGGAAAPSDLTATQVTANLNAVVGASGVANGTKGLVPQPLIANELQFLRGDGTWASPAGAGDVVGPASSSNGQIARFGDTSGKLLTATPSTISNSDIDAAAAIAFSKLATLTSGNILVGSAGNVATSVAMSGEATIVASGAVTLANSAVIGKVLTGYTSGAGTVAATDTILEAVQKLNGNDALKQPLATLTTKGDLYVATSGSTVVRQGVGSDDLALFADSTQTNGIIYKNSINDPSWLNNIGIAASVAANALTIAVKTSAGSDASSSDPIKAAFGSSTITSGQFSIVSLTAALSLTISSGSTLGQRNATESDIYVFLINNAGTIKLGVSRVKLPEDTLWTSVAEGGAGGADLSYELYSDAVYTNVRIRCIGIITNTQATAGTWATSPSKIVVASRSMLPAQVIEIALSSTAGQTVANATFTKLDYNVINSDPLSLYVSADRRIYQPVTGCSIVVSANIFFSNTTAFNGTTEPILAGIYKNNTTTIRGFSDIYPDSLNSEKFSTVNGSFSGVRGQYLVVQFYQNSGGSIALNASAEENSLYVTITIN